MNSDSKRFALALVLSAGVIMGWNYFFPAPQAPVQDKAVVTKAVEQEVAPAVQSDSKAVAKVDSKREYEKYTLSSDISTVVIDSTLSIVDYKNANDSFDFVATAGKANALQIQILQGDKFVVPHFNLVVSGDKKSISGSDSNLGIEFRASIDEKGKFNYSFKSSNQYRYRLAFESTAKRLDNGQIRNYVMFVNSDVERIEVGDEEVADGNVKWIGLDFNYHLFAMTFADKKAVRYKTTELGRGYFDISEPLTNLNGSFIFTKKIYDDLIGLGDKLELSVDFGIFGILAVPLLRGLQWLYKVIPNYGFAIIILTLFIRLLLYPLQHKSAKSMKKMQKVQPELQKIKEKYKDDPARVQKETMEIFKKNGANPLGGCLPLLLQMPVFFAIYRVLYSAVELVDAPFIGWIADLSQKDPYYVLPVLMAATMFGQQLLMPTATTDPNQKKIMMAMPLIFGFIMKDLPSGLVLYIFVSTLFGVVQQLIVNKTAD